MAEPFHKNSYNRSMSLCIIIVLLLNFVMIILIWLMGVPVFYSAVVAHPHLYFDQKKETMEGSSCHGLIPSTNKSTSSGQPWQPAFIVVITASASSTTVHSFAFLRCCQDRKFVLEKVDEFTLEDSFLNYAKLPQKLNFLYGPLLQRAQSFVPQNYWRSTPLLFRAMPTLKQSLFKRTRRTMLSRTFAVLKRSVFQLRSSQVTLLSQDEATADKWFSAAFLTGRLYSDSFPPLAFVDLDGETLQISAPITPEFTHPRSERGTAHPHSIKSGKSRERRNDHSQKTFDGRQHNVVRKSFKRILSEKTLGKISHWRIKGTSVLNPFDGKYNEKKSPNEVILNGKRRSEEVSLKKVDNRQVEAATANRKGSRAKNRSIIDLSPIRSEKLHSTTLKKKIMLETDKIGHRHHLRTTTFLLRRLRGEGLRDYRIHYSITGKMKPLKVTRDMISVKEKTRKNVALFNRKRKNFQSKKLIKRDSNFQRVSLKNGISAGFLSDILILNDEIINFTYSNCLGVKNKRCRILERKKMGEEKAISVKKNAKIDYPSLQRARKTALRPKNDSPTLQFMANGKLKPFYKGLISCKSLSKVSINRIKNMCRRRKLKKKFLSSKKYGKKFERKKKATEKSTKRFTEQNFDKKSSQGDYFSSSRWRKMESFSQFGPITHELMSKNIWKSLKLNGKKLFYFSETDGKRITHDSFLNETEATSLRNATENNQPKFKKKMENYFKKIRKKRDSNYSARTSKNYTLSFFTNQINLPLKNKSDAENRDFPSKSKPNNNNPDFSRIKNESKAPSDLINSERVATANVSVRSFNQETRDRLLSPSERNRESEASLKSFSFRKIKRGLKFSKRRRKKGNKTKTRQKFSSIAYRCSPLRKFWLRAISLPFGIYQARVSILLGRNKMFPTTTDTSQARPPIPSPVIPRRSDVTPEEHYGDIASSSKFSKATSSLPIIILPSPEAKGPSNSSTDVLISSHSVSSKSSDFPSIILTTPSPLEVKSLWTDDTLIKVTEIVDSILRATSNKSLHIKERKSKKRFKGRRNRGLLFSLRKFKREKWVISLKNGTDEKSIKFNKTKNMQRKIKHLAEEISSMTSKHPKESINSPFNESQIMWKRDRHRKWPKNHLFLLPSKNTEISATTNTSLHPSEKGTMSPVTDLLFTLPNRRVISPDQKSAIDSETKSTEKFVKSSLDGFFISSPNNTNGALRNLNKSFSLYNNKKTLKISKESLEEPLDTLILKSPCIPLGTTGKLILDDVNYVLRHSGSENKFDDCWNEVKELVESEINVPSVNNMDIVVNRAFYFITASVGLIDGTKPVGFLKASDFKEAANIICSRPLHLVVDPLACLDYQYAAALILHGFKIDPNKQLIVTDSTSEFRISSAMGAALSYLQKH